MRIWLFSLFFFSSSTHPTKLPASLTLHKWVQHKQGTTHYWGQWSFLVISVNPNIAPEHKVLWTRLFHWLLYRHLYLYTNTEFSKSEQHPFISTLQNGNSYVRNQGCEESSTPSQLLQKPWDEQPQHLSDLSPSPWTPKPPPARYHLPPWAMLGTELKLLTLESEKRKESLSSQYQLSCVQAHSHPSPALRGPGLQWQPGATLCCHSQGPRMPPSLADRWPGQTLEGASTRLPWISAGDGWKPRWISSTKTLLPATELLRQSSSPWFLKCCWYQKVNTLQNYCLLITRASSHLLVCLCPSFLALTFRLSFPK